MMALRSTRRRSRAATEAAATSSRGTHTAALGLRNGPDLHGLALRPLLDHDVHLVAHVDGIDGDGDARAALRQDVAVAVAVLLDLGAVEDQHAHEVLHERVRVAHDGLGVSLDD